MGCWFNIFFYDLTGINVNGEGMLRVDILDHFQLLIAGILDHFESLELTFWLILSCCIWHVIWLHVMCVFGMDFYLDLIWCGSNWWSWNFLLKCMDDSPCHIYYYFYLSSRRSSTHKNTGDLRGLDAEDRRIHYAIRKRCAS